MCRISSLDEAETVIMEIQIDSARSEFELDDNGHLRNLYEKSGKLVCNFLVSCDSRVGPVSQTAIFQIFTLWYSKDYLKHTLQTALVFRREHETRYMYKKRKNEMKN